MGEKRTQSWQGKDDLGGVGGAANLTKTHCTQLRKDLTLKRAAN